MKRTRKVWFLLILAGLMAAPILGCGPTPTPTTGPEAPKAPGVPPGGP